MSVPAVAVREKPILFSGEMVRAILEGRKTQTRRVILPQPIYYATVPEEILDETPARVGNPGWWWRTPRGGFHSQPDEAAMRKMWPRMLGYCPFGAIGDRLWVRETFSYSRNDEWHRSDFWYWADGNPSDGDWERPKPSIHMPRWASRLTLEVTGVRVERVQEITEADCEAEGMTKTPGPASPRDFYELTWNLLNFHRGYGWDVNPWVWVVEFRRIDGGAA